MTGRVQTGRVWRQQASRGGFGEEMTCPGFERWGCQVAGFGRWVPPGRSEDGRNAGDGGEKESGISITPSSVAWAPGWGRYQPPRGNGEARGSGRRGSKTVQSYLGYMKCEKPAGHPSGEAQEAVRGTHGKQGRGRARGLNGPVSQEDTDAAEAWAWMRTI